MANQEFIVTAPPHIKGKDMVSTGMRDVAIALIPLVAVSLGFFRLYALVNLVACVATAITCEYVMRKLMRKEPTIGDFSAVVTGLLLALILPPTVPFWWAMIASM